MLTKVSAELEAAARRVAIVEYGRDPGYTRDAPSAEVFAENRWPSFVAHARAALAAVLREPSEDLIAAGETGWHELLAYAQDVPCNGENIARFVFAAAARHILGDADG